MSEVDLKPLQDQIKGLQAQLNAHQQMVNEQLGTNVQLRTNIYLLQQALQESGQKEQQLNADNAALTASNAELLGRVTALDGEVHALKNPTVAA